MPGSRDQSATEAAAAGILAESTYQWFGSDVLGVRHRFAKAALSRLKAAGFAVVQLPAHDENDEFGFGGRDYVFHDDGEVFGKHGTEFGSPARVRRFAGALLAAAAAAERSVPLAGGDA